MSSTLHSSSHPSSSKHEKNAKTFSFMPIEMTSKKKKKQTTSITAESTLSSVASQMEHDVQM
jgi:hypothetical protein